MVATLRQIVTVQSGGVVRVQSDSLREGTVAEVLIITESPVNTVAPPVSVPPTWEKFIGTGAGVGRSVQEIDASIRELRNEWP